MPQYERQLGDLLPLLAKLEEGGLARVLTEKVGDVAQGATVVLGDIFEPGVLDVATGRRSRSSGGGDGSGGGGHVAGGGGIVVGVGEAVVVLLLGGGEGDLLLLGLVLGLMLMLVLMLVGLVLMLMLMLVLVAGLGVHPGLLVRVGTVAVVAV